MEHEQRQQRLIAITMYYFGLMDSGAMPRLSDLRQLVDPDLHSDLMNLIAEILADQPGIAQSVEEPTAPAALVLDALRRLRGERWPAQYDIRWLQGK